MTVITTLIGIALIAKHFLPGNEFILKGEEMPYAGNAVVFNYYLGTMWLNPSVNSVWALTVYTQELRLLLALQYYMNMYRYLLVKREITTALSQPASIGHPNSLTNYAAVEVLTQYDIASGGKVRKAIKEYKQMQNIMALINLIMLYNPYTSNFVYQRGNELALNLDYQPQITLAEVVTLAYIAQLVNNYIKMMTATSSSSVNAMQLTQNSSIIAVAIIQYILLTRVLMTNSY